MKTHGHPWVSPEVLGSSEMGLRFRDDLSQDLRVPRMKAARHKLITGHRRGRKNQDRKTGSSVTRPDSLGKWFPCLPRCVLGLRPRRVVSCQCPQGRGQRGRVVAAWGRLRDHHGENRLPCGDFLCGILKSPHRGPGVRRVEMRRRAGGEEPRAVLSPPCGKGRRGRAGRGGPAEEPLCNPP